MLPQNVSKGVIISNHSLVLQGVSRTTAGNYSCVGFNSEGDGTSPPFELNVMCEYLSIIIDFLAMLLLCLCTHRKKNVINLYFSLFFPI